MIDSILTSPHDYFILGLEWSRLEPRRENFVSNLEPVSLQLLIPKPFSYLTDSLVNKIYAYDYREGKIENRRVFINALEKGFREGTYCDGLCVDVEGGVWSARYAFFILTYSICSTNLRTQVGRFSNCTFHRGG